MSQVKRRKLGSRATWRFSAEIKAVRQADIFERMESNMRVIAMVRFHALPRCLVTPVMLYNDATSTGESLYLPCIV